jgi:hypothetical protein
VGGQAFGSTWFLLCLSAQRKDLPSEDYKTVVCIIFDLRFGFRFEMALGYNEGGYG